MQFNPAIQSANKLCAYTHAMSCRTCTSILLYTVIFIFTVSVYTVVR